MSSSLSRIRNTRQGPSRIRNSEVGNAATIPRKTAKAALNGHHTTPKSIDPLEAQYGALRHVLCTGDTNKLSDLKDNAVTPQHFQDPNARTIAEAL